MGEKRTMTATDAKEVFMSEILVIQIEAREVQ